MNVRENSGGALSKRPLRIGYARRLESAAPLVASSHMNLEGFNFLNPREEISFSANRLPHWQQRGGIYFVTFRLGDAIPQAQLERWSSERDAWFRIHSRPLTEEDEREFHDRFVVVIERWLDAGSGSCVLRRRDCAAYVAGALRHFEGMRYEQISWVIMPNHVHALFGLKHGHALAQVLHSWKLYSARHINRAIGASGRLWQRDYFDRLVRNYAHLARCVRYIRNNPVRAKLDPGEYLRFESDLARLID
jgi:REP element-mobilizing transposase RayT